MGRGQAALDVATELGERLSVTLLLLDADDVLLPETISVPIYTGRIRKASGHLGAFDIEVDGYAAMLPSSKNSLQFVLPRDGVSVLVRHRLPLRWPRSVTMISLTFHWSSSCWGCR